MREQDVPGVIGPNPLRSWRFWLHLPNFIKLFWRLFRDKRVPLLPKVILLVGIAYVVSPADILPEFLGWFGLLDDAVIMYLVLRGFIALCPSNVVEEHVRLISEGA